MGDQNNTKTSRNFECRDYLYDVFLKMSLELNCSVDYLINEAMREYARTRDVPLVPVEPSAAASEPEAQQAFERPVVSEHAQALTVPSDPVNQPIASQPTQEVEPEVRVEIVSDQPTTETQPEPDQFFDAMDDVTNPAAPAISIPPPLPGKGPPTAPPIRPQLFLVFNDEKRPIEQDEFIIGRGAKTADLAIRDGNISRRHAAIIFQDGAYYIKDLGSTNGISYGNRRVESKRIEEGDVYKICDYELQFTFQ